MCNLKIENSDLHDQCKEQLLQFEDSERQLHDEIEKRVAELDLVTYYNHCLNDDMAAFQERLAKMEISLKQSEAQIETIKKDVAVKPQKASKCHCFRLIHKNWEPIFSGFVGVVHNDSFKHPIHTKFKYTTVCVQKHGLSKAMKCLHDKFPKLEILLDLPYHPNAISLNNHIKESLNKSVAYNFR